ncbi:uncharacterized protein PG986_005766 [Apiospora aurea]|uniref:chitinase n=1 Tax=Apiospora aurea TaxID=335848 RepID=A0ABR1QIH4_9PEZI
MCGMYSKGGKEKCGMNLCCSAMGWCGTTETYCGNADPQGNTLPCQKDSGSWVVKSGKTCGTGSGTTNGRTIGYYQGSNTRERLCNKIFPADIASKGYTHLYYAFASIDPNSFGVVPAHSGDVELYEQFTALKSRGLETSKLVSSASSRAAFINSLKTFMAKYGFQGVDLDWEYPEMHASFAGQFGLSLTLAPDYWYLRYFDAKAMESSVDFFGFMAYDLHGYWHQDVKTLGSVVRGQADIRDIATDTLPLWFDELDASKINFGVALYGRGYTLASPNCNDLLCGFSGPSKPGRFDPSKDHRGDLWQEEWKHGLWRLANRQLLFRFGLVRQHGRLLQQRVPVGRLRDGGETADGTCGLAHKHTTCGSWPAGDCYSAAGYCGNTKAHCGEGCQSGGCGWRILDGERVDILRPGG